MSQISLEIQLELQRAGLTHLSQRLEAALVEQVETAERLGNMNTLALLYKEKNETYEAAQQQSIEAYNSMLGQRTLLERRNAELVEEVKAVREGYNGDYADLTQRNNKLQQRYEHVLETERTLKTENNRMKLVLKKLGLGPDGKPLPAKMVVSRVSKADNTLPAPKR